MPRRESKLDEKERREVIATTIGVGLAISAPLIVVFTWILFLCNATLLDEIHEDETWYSTKLIIYYDTRTCIQ